MSPITPSQPVFVSVGRDEIAGDLNIRDDSKAIVVFAHGSGSSRHSPRNKYVAQILNEGGIATLLIDLLTVDEEAIDMRTAHLRFNIRLLADRLASITDWLPHRSATAKLPIGYFGASTGAAAALVAAAKRPDVVEAVVSRGGRPDLAGLWLTSVHAPTLLIVGGNDPLVIDLNYQAASELHAIHRIEIIPGAGHLFEGPGALDKVAHLATEWFQEYLITNRSKAA